MAGKVRPAHQRTPRLKRGEMPWFLLAALLLSFLPSCQQGTSLGNNEPSAPDGDPIPTRKVVALGRLEPKGEVVNLTAPPGDRLTRLTVSRGDTIKAGQELAYLESFDERLAAKNQAFSRLMDAEAMLNSETKLGEALIAESEIRLRQLEEQRPLQIEAQRARVRDLEAQLALAEQDEERVAKLGDRGATSQQTIDHQRTEVQRFRSGLESARAELERLVKSFENDHRLADAQLTTAKAMLVRNKEALQVPTLRADLEYAEVLLKQSSLRSPISGKVLDILTRPGEATGFKPIMQLGDIADLYAVAEVYETEVRFIRVGHKARVSSRALSEEILGTVEEIGSIVTKNEVLDIDPAAEADRRVIEVWVRLEDRAEASGLINLQVDVEIDCGQDPAD